MHSTSGAWKEYSFQPRWRCCCERIWLARRERDFERRLECSLALDLAADVADHPAQPAAQDAQLPTVAVELFGVGIAARHHRRALGDARCRIAAAARRAFCARRLSPLIAACSSLASVGKVMALGCTVVSTVTRVRSLAA